MNSVLNAIVDSVETVNHTLYIINYRDFKDIIPIPVEH